MIDSIRSLHSFASTRPGGSWNVWPQAHHAQRAKTKGPLDDLTQSKLPEPPLEFASGDVLAAPLADCRDGDITAAATKRNATERRRSRSLKRLRRYFGTRAMSYITTCSNEVHERFLPGQARPAKDPLAWDQWRLERVIRSDNCTQKKAANPSDIFQPCLFQYLARTRMGPKRTLRFE